jgi:hypothetical protein
VGVVDLAGLPVVVVVVDDDDVSAELRDFGRVVVVVADDFGGVVVVVVDFGRVVVVVDVFEPVVVVVAAVDFERVVVVVVAVDLDGPDPVVDVVDAVATAGAVPSSPPGASSRPWVGPDPGLAGAGGRPGTGLAGGGIRSSRRAYCMIRAKTGAATWPP